MYSFKYNSNNLAIEFQKFVIPYAAISKGNILIKYSGLEYKFVDAVISIPEIYELNLVDRSQRINGWNWSFNFAKNDDYYYSLAIDFDSVDPTRSPKILDERITLTVNTILSKEDFSSFMEEFNYFAKWVNLETQKL